MDEVPKPENETTDPQTSNALSEVDVKVEILQEETEEIATSMKQMTVGDNQVRSLNFCNIYPLFYKDKFALRQQTPTKLQLRELSIS